jgi:hypothetical protein
MAGRGKADFSKKTCRILGDRAGWRCSVPGCNALTIGPGNAPNEVAQVGTAAHIYSAALQGPRGRGQLTDAQLADVNNGIWCCATHGREIDTNTGRGYTVETLQAWKRLREEQARVERTGLGGGAGWLDEVTVEEGPLFAPKSVLKLAKAVLVKGGGSVGKTALLDWIAGAAGHASLERWEAGRPCAKPVRLDLRYHSPKPHRLEFTFADSRRGYLLDGQLIHTPPPDLQIVFLRENAKRHLHGKDDD